jgi:CHASE2 domain-containing sensor protein
MNSRERRKQRRKLTKEQEAKIKPSFRVRLLRAVPFFLISAVLTFLLSQAGTFIRLETTALDLQMQLREPPPESDVAVVRITNEDYRNLFGGKSPLNPVQLQNIINAIALGKPKAIGVDIITSASEFRGINIPSDVPIIWARTAVYSNKEKSFYLNDVLGEREPAPPFGLTTLKEDSDGILRRYQRVFKTEQYPVPSFPWAVLKPANSAPANLSENEEELFINFAGNPQFSNRVSLPASQVLTMAGGEGWQTESPIKGKIVLLGGDYAVQDEYNTPLGWMLGVDVLANIIETELQGGGRRPASRIVIGLLQIADGLVLLLLFHFLSFKKAVGFSLLAILPLSAVCSLLTYTSLGYWSYFAPILLAVLLQQIYDRFKDYRKEFAIDAMEKIEPGVGEEKQKSA